MGVKQMARVIRAEVARARGRQQQALAILGDPGVWLHHLPTATDYSIAHERFLRGELLRELNRPNEAIQWYATFPDPQAYDLMYLGFATLRRADLYDRLGNRSAALRSYQRLASLWRDADPELKPLRDAAVKRIQALGG